VLLLCFRRTRFPAWCALVAFHVATWVLFPIGVFPWVMIGVSTIFFAPDWPRRVLARFGRPSAVRRPVRRENLWAWRLAVAWVALLLVLPLRAAVIPGDSRWTSEGYRFAWNVLRVERAGDVVFRITNRTTGVTRVDTAAGLYTPLQWKTMATEPELIRQAAHALRTQAEARGESVEVRVDAFTSLNGRPAARMVDPDVDLSREPYRPFGQPWILPAPTTDPP
jgi:vitamin K-dependent gamma-carboxylase